MEDGVQPGIAEKFPVMVTGDIWGENRVISSCLMVLLLQFLGRIPAVFGALDLTLWFQSQQEKHRIGNTIIHANDSNIWKQFIHKNKPMVFSGLSVVSL